MEMRLPTGHVQLIDISDKDSVGRYGELNKLVHNAPRQTPRFQVFSFSKMRWKVGKCSV